MEYEWWNSVYEDFKAIAGILGFDVHDMQFSGFWSQGDGASFTGNYAYKKGCIAAIKEYAPKDETLHAIARDIVAMQKPAFYRIEGTIYRQSHLYSHENTIRADSDDLTEIARRLCQWLYTKLEEEHDYLTAWHAGSCYAIEGENVASAKAELKAILAERRAVKGVAAPALCAAIRQTVDRLLSDIYKARAKRATLLAGDDSEYGFWTGNKVQIQAFWEGAGK